MATALLALTLLVTGTLVGIELFVAVLLPRVLDPLPDTAALDTRVSGARLLGKVMPPWYITALVLTGVVAAIGLAAGERGGWAALAACATFVVATVLSIVLLVPINNRVRTWADGSAPPDWRSILARWERIHLLRVAVVAAGLVLLGVSAGA